MYRRTLAQSQHRVTHTANVGTGRGFILFVAISQIIVGSVLTALTFNPDLGAETRNLFLALGISNLVIGVLFIGFWVWAKWQPLPAAISALAVYVALQVAAVAQAPQAIGQGIFLKILFVAALIKAVQSAYALKQGELVA